MRKIYLIIYELTCGDSLQNHPNATDTIIVLIEQNNILLNNNTALHQQVQQLVLRLNQQPVKSDRQLQGTLSNNTLTAELHEVKKKFLI
ncbi:unnamed protein product [Rotaria magnacalcarata]|uniref:Uncharacterized protein n=2 Tax=Rotaria magnacalcarata TaxID=392030 RepID=A0A816LZM7_9BILA|nr:unnamed protein product [Rotaria magnacalcarata]CAF2116430.1 unnamed protein product [Rotaria magnacalcarata]CAF3903894.1 unnamed protein product [Rotaria magnacalcarata]